MKLLIVFSAIAVALQFHPVAATTDKVVCYYGSWANYRNGNGKFTVGDIDPTLCTHLVYGFVGINTDGSINILDSWLEIDSGNFKKFNALKSRNPELKTLVAIGGWNEGSARYSQVARDPVKRATLIRSAVNLLQTYGFDGFDLDWEYPGQRGGAREDIANYITLLQEFRQEFNKHGYLLTAAVAAAGSSVDQSYDVPEMSKYLDIINVMAYDFHGAYDEVTGQNAPLYASSLETAPELRLLNVDAAIRGWIERGANPAKLSMGVGSYGRTFTLSDPSNTNILAPVSASGNAAPYTREAGMIGYNEICEYQKQGGWNVVWDDEQKVPYMFKGNQWIGYDDPTSVAIKVEYAKSLNLGGVMIWSLETDDFRGVCGQKFLLLNTIKETLGGKPNPKPTSESTSGSTSEPTPRPSSESTPRPTSESTSGPTQSTTEQSSNDSLCNKPGYVKDPQDCAVFYYCMADGNAYVALKQRCTPGLVFDLNNLSCDYPELVQC